MRRGVALGGKSALLRRQVGAPCFINRVPRLDGGAGPLGHRQRSSMARRVDPSLLMAIRFCDFGQDDHSPHNASSRCSEAGSSAIRFPLRLSDIDQQIDDILGDL